jgi:hypothetical protein
MYRIKKPKRAAKTQQNGFRGIIIIIIGTRGSVVVKALCVKPEGRGFQNRYKYQNLK